MTFIDATKETTVRDLILLIKRVKDEVLQEKEEGSVVFINRAKILDYLSYHQDHLMMAVESGAMTFDSKYSLNYFLANIVGIIADHFPDEKEPVKLVS
jgi:hypothetical protein